MNPFAGKSQNSPCCGGDDPSIYAQNRMAKPPQRMRARVVSGVRYPGYINPTSKQL
jgi:hypothetical protein